MNAAKGSARASVRTCGLALLAVAAAQALALYALGRVPICTCGYVKLWHGVVLSAENSQHVADWYSFSHIIHGFALYGLLWLVARRWPVGMRFVAAALIEAVWETVENSSFVIDRYRAITISLDYYGDSILNSVSDTFFCAAGFALASRLPVAATVALAVAMEVGVAAVIRDNLTLNIIMLIYPLAAIKAWQEGR
jgi:Protein of unknown function (DUF2585)